MDNRTEQNRTEQNRTEQNRTVARKLNIINRHLNQHDSMSVGIWTATKACVYCSKQTLNSIG